MSSGSNTPQPWLDACEWAGRLAERGVQSVVIDRGAGQTPIHAHARRDDLPRLMAESPPGTKLIWSTGELSRTGSGWVESAASQPGG